MTTKRNVKPSAASWIREHANFEAPGNAEVVRLQEGASAAGFPVTFSGARSAYYMALKAKQQGRKMRARTVKVHAVNPTFTIVSNIRKELELLAQEVERLKKVEKHYNSIVAIMGKEK